MRNGRKLKPLQRLYFLKIPPSIAEGATMAGRSHHGLVNLDEAIASFDLQHAVCRHILTQFSQHASMEEWMILMIS